MIFSSPLFLFVFLPAVLGIYTLLPGIRSRNLWLLSASLLFYSWSEPGFVAVLIISVLVNFILSRGLERQTDARRRRRILTVGIAANLGLLALFKYANSAVNLAFHLAGANAVASFDFFVLPMGISFFTFHALSYLMDVYRQKQKAATRPGDLALYIFFFPQMIAGPILRWQAIAPQLAARQHSLDKVAEGIRRFVGGLAKKAIMANTMAWTADQIFSLPATQLSMADAWLGAVCYTLQIYFDFSGYSDMAVGLGKMLGFEFMENFRFPYMAGSIRDFWRRWHISLSTWFRDYLYYPLGGNRGSHVRTGINLFIVFLLCGLWHGASWTFVIWGLYHGCFLVLERTRFGSFMERGPRLFAHVYALLVILIGWVVFRANDIQVAGYYLCALAGFGSRSGTQPLLRYATPQMVSFIVIGIFFSTSWWEISRRRLVRAVAGKPLVGAIYSGCETAGVMVIFFLALAWLAGDTYKPFIYFRF